MHLQILSARPKMKLRLLCYFQEPLERSPYAEEPPTASALEPQPYPQSPHPDTQGLPANRGHALPETKDLQRQKQEQQNRLP